MEEIKARTLLVKLINAAYEAGIHSNNPKGLIFKAAQREAEKIKEEIVGKLSE